MKKYSLQKGFTLIELLVVVAIIAMLSAAVLVSLNSARSKAKDARVQSEMQQLKSAMELYYSNNSGYATGDSNDGGDNCATLDTYGVTTNGGPGSLTAAITRDSGDELCRLSKESWAFSVKLPGGNYWCVDSNGVSIDGSAVDDGNGGNYCKPN